MFSQIKTIGTGLAGIGLVQAAAAPDPTTVPDIAKALIQVIIAIVTLWQLLKKKKSS